MKRTMKKMVSMALTGTMAVAVLEEQEQVK